MRLRVVSLLAVLGVLLAGCGGGTPEAAGPSEGIQVHGDWTINIYNEDGTLDRSVEFENALSGGHITLANLLSRTESLGFWEIIMSDSLTDDGDDQPCVNLSGPTSCIVTEPQASFDSSHRSTNLEVTSSLGELRLFGSHTISADGSISGVATRVRTCAPGDSDPVACQSNGFPRVFTQTEYRDPDTGGIGLPVANGQQVQVEVVISFTSG